MRPPDFVIGDTERPYLRRWWVIPRNRFFNIYLHEILRSDDDRALHDHPWWNVSLILKGGYWEWKPGLPKYPPGEWKSQIDDFKRITYAVWRGRWSVIFRRPTAAHRLELASLYQPSAHEERPCWSLFITGPRVREWGFHCPKGWKHWKEFTKAGEPGQVGPGCGE